MASFFTKLKPAAAAQNAANNASPNKKSKEEPAPELTPLEKMLLNAGPVRDDGTDKFFGMENFGNTCYCNSMLQVLYHTESFRENVIRFPPYSPADTPNGKPKAVPVRIRPAPDPATVAAATGAATPATAASKKPGGTPQQRGQRAPVSPAQLANGQIVPMRPEDRPDSPEYKKKQAMIKGPILELTDNASAYGMEECTFTSVKDIFMAFIESSSRTGVLSPNRLLEIFRQENDMFRTAMHQDAHEFYGLVLNDIIRTVEDMAVKRRQQKDLSDSAGLTQSVTAALSNGNGSYNNGSASNALARVVSSLDGTSTPGSGWVHDIFEGVLTSETRCLTCETASQRDETFLDLSIDLEEHSSVTSCLRKFSAEEMLCERNKFHCDRCGGLQEAEKRMKIKRLPRILALHLKRFKYSEDYTKLEKLFHRVVYPYHLRMFNTTEDAEDPDRLYELYAVVVHIGGNAYHGHYVSVIKTREHGWLLFDDEMVEPVDKHYVRNFFGDKPGTACAYVLFYQETTFEKVQAEQERESLEEIKLASQSAGLALSPDGHATAAAAAGHNQANGVNGGIGHLWKQATLPAVTTPLEGPDEFVSLEHAKTAPGMDFVAPVASSPQTTAAVGGGGGGASPSLDKAVNANAKAEAARLKEEREREKKEAKVQEKARKAQEKEQAKEQDRQRKERERELEAQRKAETEELRRAIAASKQSAAEEKEARKKSLDGGAEGSGGVAGGSGSGNGGGNGAGNSSKGTGFLSRSGRGSKSMSRRSFGFLGKDKDKERAKLAAAAVAESPFGAADQASTSNNSNGSANGGGGGGSSSNASSAQLAHGAAAAAAAAIPPVPPIPASATSAASAASAASLGTSAPSSPAVQPTGPPATPMTSRNRFSINLGRKVSKARLP